MKSVISIVFILVCQASFAQNEEHNWYFGKYAALSFETGTARPKYDNASNVYRKTASISDRESGRLLFYTDGKTVWNHRHRSMEDNTFIVNRPTGDVMIVPVPGSTVKYAVLFIGEGDYLRGMLVDMSLNAGDGEVLNALNVPVSSGNGPQIAVIRHRYADAYWIIVHETGNNRFKAYYFDANGFSSQPVISEAGLPVQTLGDIVGSNKGDKLALTHFYGNDFKAEVFDFDRVCGTVSRPVELYKPDVWDHAYGIAFSPDDSKLYITYGVAQSQLIQYYDTDYGSSYFIGSSPQNFNIMQLGPDGRIYMATHDNGIPGQRINAILNPNALAGSCDFRETYLRLDEGTGKGRVANFELPHFVTGQRLTAPVKDGVFSFSGTCLGDTTRFLFNTTNPYDSLLWSFGPGTSGESRLVAPLCVYPHAGSFAVTLTVFRCGMGFALRDTVTIRSVPVIAFATDTTVCAGLPVLLQGPPAEKYAWSTGETTRSIVRSDTGTVVLTASNGDCASLDSIRILVHPDILLLLGDEYFLCEDDDELVMLDAGEGFMHYLWTPTLDTTQWIIVKNTGDYFVKVTDHFGCPGTDQSEVKRRCGVLLHFPNAFSPNQDGVNDVYGPSGTDVVSYRMNIYDRWGALVFSTDVLEKGWKGTIAGKPAADGVYVYEAEYTGYRNKRLQTFFKKGSFTLLR